MDIFPRSIIFLLLISNFDLLNSGKIILLDSNRFDYFISSRKLSLIVLHYCNIALDSHLG